MFEWSSSNEHHVFDIAQALTNIYTTLSLSRTAIGLGKIYIMPEKFIPSGRIKCIAKDGHLLLDRHQYYKVSHRIMKKNGMMIIRVYQEFNPKKYPSINLSLFDDYIFQLCELMCMSLKCSTQTIYRHLSERCSGRYKLTHYSHVKLTLSEVLLNLSQMNQFLRVSSPRSKGNGLSYQAVFDLYRDSLLSLSKLYGGRSFLCGELLERMMLFDAFKGFLFSCGGK